MSNSQRQSTELKWRKVHGEVFRNYKNNKENFFSSGATTFNKKLVLGDQVWVQTEETDTYNGYNVFAGHIIHPNF